MARIFMDGFESGGLELWDMRCSSSFPTGNLGYGSTAVSNGGLISYRVFSASLSECWLLKRFSSLDTICFKFHIYLTGIGGNGASEVIQFYNATGIQCSLGINLNRTLTAYRGSRTGTALGTGTAIVPFNSWTLIEGKIYCADAGTFQVKVNGVEYDINFSGDTMNQATTGMTYLKVGCCSVGASLYHDAYLDDFVLDDANWIGNTKIQVIAPSGVGNSTQFTLPSNTPGFDHPLCSGGTSLKSSEATNHADHAFDNDLGTFWSPTEAIGAHAMISYIGYDFGAGVTKDIVGFTLIHGYGGGMTYGTAHPHNVILRYSDDGTTWVNTETVRVEDSAFGVIFLNTGVDFASFYKISKSYGAHRYWSLLAQDNPITYAWKVFELEFHEAETANWNAVGVANALGDPYIMASCVRSNTNGNIDTYAMGNLSGTVGAVRSVQAHVRARKNGSPAVTNIKLVARPGSTDQKSANKALSTEHDYSAPFNVWETNPDTAAAWAESEVNASEFGFEANT